MVYSHREVKRIGGVKAPGSRFIVNWAASRWTGLRVLVRAGENLVKVEGVEVFAEEIEEKSRER